MKTALKIIIVIYIILAAKLFAAEYFFQNEEYHRAYKLQPKNTQYLNAKGRYYENRAARTGITAQQVRENLEKSEKYRSQAIKGSPTQAIYYASYGWLLGNLGRHGDAVSYYEKALTLGRPGSRRLRRMYEQYLERK